MTPNDTIRELLLEYPSLFKSRGDVLHHLFCVIGNGYEWVDGELVSRYSDDRSSFTNPTDRAIDRILTRLRLNLADDARSNNSHVIDVELSYKALAEINYARNAIDIRLNNYTFEGSLYPACPDYAKLWNYPDDLSYDWMMELGVARGIFLPLYAKV